MDKSVNDTVFDAILARALLDASEADLAEAPKTTHPEEKYPEKYKKAERKKYNSKPGTRHPAAWKWVVAVTVGIVLLLAIILYAAIRAEAFPLVTMIGEKYVSLSWVTPGVGYETPEFLFRYISEDLVDVDVSTNPLLSSYTFTSADGERIVYIDIQPAEHCSIQYDNEHTVFREIKINGYNGYYITSDRSSKDDIVWSDDITIFSVYGNLPKKELIKIAEKIQRYPQETP